MEKYMRALNFKDQAWLGAYSDGIRYQWVTGEEFEYSNWYPGMPDCAKNSENFIEIDFNTSYRWNDISPQPLRAFICEWEAE